MGDCNPCLLPMNPGTTLTKAKPHESLNEVEKKRYQVMIGSLGYLMNCSRPDIAFAVRKLGLYIVCPSEKHLIATKYVFRYIKNTIDAYISIGRYQLLDNSEDIPPVSAFFDASFADDVDNRRSMFGYMIQFGRTTILWKSKKHKSVTLSTTDSEYVATTETTREISWIQNIFEEISIPLKLPITLYGDNANANGLANNVTVTAPVRRSSYCS